MVRSFNSGRVELRAVKRMRYNQILEEIYGLGKISCCVIYFQSTASGIAQNLLLIPNFANE